MKLLLASICALCFTVYGMSENHIRELDIRYYEYNILSDADSSYTCTKVFEICNNGKSSLWLRFFDRPTTQYNIKNVYQDFFGSQYHLYRNSQEILITVYGYGGNFYKVLSPGAMFKYIILIPDIECEESKKRINYFTKEKFMTYFQAFKADDIFSYKATTLGLLLKELSIDNPVAFFPFDEYVVLWR